MQRLMSLLICCAIAVGGCNDTATKPDTQAPTLVSAEFGLFNPVGTGEMTFVPTSVVPLTPNQFYGWKMVLRTPQSTIKWREDLTLPAKPASWGTPETEGTRTLSADGKTATTQREVSPVQGAISNTWAVASGDPKGRYVMKVAVEGLPVKTFTFTVQ